MGKHVLRLGIVLLAVVTATAGCGLVSPPTTARFDIEPPVLYVDESVRLDGSPSIGESALVDFTWDLGNGESASGREVTATYGAPGSYTIALTVEDASGRTSTAAEEIIVYVRGGTQIFYEDFSAGPEALGEWALDPTWASINESRIEYIASAPGYTLFIDTRGDRWHRRYMDVSFPPLRLGQRLVFTCRAMTLQNQDSHTFIIVPGRRGIASPTGSLPYYEFTSDGGGSYTREPTTYGLGVGHPVAFTPQIYLWHTYSFVYTEDAYELWIDGILWHTGPVSVDLSDGGEWFVLLGEESSAEACSVYFDDIRISVEE